MISAPAPLPRPISRAPFGIALLALLALPAVYTLAGVLVTWRGGAWARPIDANNLGAAMIPALALALYLRSRIGAALFASVLLVTASRAAWLGLAGMIAAILWMQIRAGQVNRRGLLLLGAGLLFALPLLIIGWQHPTHGTIAQRLDLWRVGLLAFTDAPLWGGEYRAAFLRYALPIHDRVHFHAHSLPIQVIAQFGLFGLALLAGLAYYAIQRVRFITEARRRRIAIALLVGIAANGLADYVYWSPLNLLVLAAVWLVIAEGGGHGLSMLTRRGLNLAGRSVHKGL